MADIKADAALLCSRSILRYIKKKKKKGGRRKSFPPSSSPLLYLRHAISSAYWKQRLPKLLRRERTCGSVKIRETWISRLPWITRIYRVAVTSASLDGTIIHIAVVIPRLALCIAVVTMINATSGRTRASETATSEMPCFLRNDNWSVHERIYCFFSREVAHDHPAFCRTYQFSTLHRGVPKEP